MKFLACLLSILIIFAPVVSYAQQPTVAIIKKDQQAPFDGVLYNNEAYADQKAEKELAKQKHQNEMSYRLRTLELKLKFATATTTIELNSLREESSKIYAIKDKHIKFLEKKLVETNSSAWENALWFGLGVGAVVLGAWAIKQVKN